MPLFVTPYDNQAMTYLRSRRSIVNPHEGFMAQLETFDVKLNSEREAAIADGQEKKVRDAFWSGLPMC